MAASCRSSNFYPGLKTAVALANCRFLLFNQVRRANADETGKKATLSMSVISNGNTFWHSILRALSPYKTIIRGDLFMKKSRLYKALIASVLFCAAVVLPLNASAASVQDRAAQIAGSTNQKITEDVQRIQATYQILSQQGFSDDSVQVQNQCSLLQKEVAKTVADAEQKLDKLGVQYECTYYTVYIGGNNILIDPFLCV